MRRWLIGLVLLVGAAMASPADASIVFLNAQPEGSWSLETQVSGFTFDRVAVTSLDPANNLEVPYLDDFGVGSGLVGPYTPDGTWSLEGGAGPGFAAASGFLIGGGDPDRNAFSWMTYFNNDIGDLSQWQITLYDGAEIEMDGIATWEDGQWTFGCVCPADDVVPEPSTFIIWSCLGLGGMGLNVWRRRKGPRSQTADRVGNVAWSDDTRVAVRAIIDRGRIG